MKTILPLYLTTLLLLWGFATYAQKTPDNQSTQKVSAQNPYAKGVIIEHAIDDKGNTVIRKRGTLKPISSARKTYLNNTNPTKTSASTATFRKSEKISSPATAPAISQIRKIEQEIIALQNSDKIDKAIRISKLEKLLEKKKIEQALLRNQ